MTELVCPICGRTFARRAYNMRYCGPACAKVAHSRQVRELQIAKQQARKRAQEGGKPTTADEEMAAITANACRAVGALSRRQRMRLEILFDTEGEGDGQDCD